jgi:hypothetical protein
MIAPIAYSRRGSASVGYIGAGWPFGKIEVSSGCVTVRALWKSRTLTLDQVKRVETLGLLDNGPGVRLWFRDPDAREDEFVDFVPWSDNDGILAALSDAGFRIS